MSDLEADKYNAQLNMQSQSPYKENVFEGLRASALSPAKFVGSITDAYRTLDATGILPVQAKLYSNRVSPVLGYEGQQLPKISPAQANPDINWIMDFNTADLYTYRGVYTPGTEDMEDAAGKEEREELVKKKSWVYENAPVKSAVFEGGLPETDSTKYHPKFPGYPDMEREFNYWGKDSVDSSDQANYVRPVKGWPFRIQRIPLCVDENDPLYPLSGCKTVSGNSGCSGNGSGGCVNGYFYTLATDPVIFTGEEDYEGTTVPWISSGGFLPLSTHCSSASTDFTISGVGCDYDPNYPQYVDDYTTADCVAPGCLTFDPASFAVEPKIEESGCDSYTVHSRGVSITVPPVVYNGKFKPCEGGIQRTPPDHGKCIGWDKICEVTQDAEQKPETVEITYSWVIEDANNLPDSADGFDSSETIEQESGGANPFAPEISEALFKAQVRAAFEEWKIIFQSNFPWLTINFTDLGDETDSDHPSPGTNYPLPDPDNKGDFRIAKHNGPIDAQGGVLAHAYTGCNDNGDVLGGTGGTDGDLHFSGEDFWRLDGTASSVAGEYSIKLVAVHEIGHSLGLQHVKDASAIMAPTADKNRNWDGFKQADINELIRIYGLNVGNANLIGPDIAGCEGHAHLAPAKVFSANNIQLGQGFKVSELDGGPCGGNDVSVANPQISIELEYPKVGGWLCDPDGCVGDYVENEFALLEFSKKDFRVQWGDDCKAEIFACPPGFHVSGITGGVVSNFP